MYRSAKKSGVLDRITFVQNGVDNERRRAIMSIVKGNNGGSFLKSRGDEKEIHNQSKNLIKLLNKIDMKTIKLS